MALKLFLIVSCFSLLSFTYTTGDWKLELDKNGIKVYTRTVINSDFKEFKGEVIVKGKLEDIANIIFDVEKYPEWCYKAESARIIEKDTALIRYFFITETPGFLKTRVACFEFTRENNSQTGEIVFNLKDIKCDLPISDNMLIIPIMKGYWKITPVGNDRAKVTMQMLTEPGGVIPAWLANLVVVDSPYITLRNLSERVSLRSNVSQK